ncbi:hypothetical protein SAMN02910317_01377 [Ruminococcaceae bacterium FB2012]|nr:hypothetical protein SAMN02910317_01377 [Ruminococcaceae bacterium FB2012]
MGLDMDDIKGVVDTVIDKVPDKVPKEVKDKAKEFATKENIEKVTDTVGSFISEKFGKKDEDKKDEEKKDEDK